MNLIIYYYADKLKAENRRGDRLYLEPVRRRLFPPGDDNAARRKNSLAHPGRLSGKQRFFRDLE